MKLKDTSNLVMECQDYNESMFKTKNINASNSRSSRSTLKKNSIDLNSVVDERADEFRQSDYELTAAQKAQVNSKNHASVPISNRQKSSHHF